MLNDVPCSQWAHIGGGDAAGGLSRVRHSLDFELMWGVRDSKTIDRYGRNILGVRQAIPRLLDLFHAYDLACTWATVGLLFFDEKDALLEALPELRPGYADPNRSPYGEIERVGPNERKDPFHFGCNYPRIKKPRQDRNPHLITSIAWNGSEERSSKPPGRDA